VAVGDILISCVGTFGKIAIVPPDVEPGIINPRLIRLRCNQLITPDLLAGVLRSTVVFEQFSVLSRGGTMDVISIATLSGIYVAVPPACEQTPIVQFINQCTARFDALVTEAEAAISLLKERRSALISAAVTGKIDVREFA
jgi:type I restriction enzyme S subunit